MSAAPVHTDGASLEPARNESGEGLISAVESTVAVWVILTDEERLIARQMAVHLH
jgi:acetate kinase